MLRGQSKNVSQKGRERKGGCNNRSTHTGKRHASKEGKDIMRRCLIMNTTDREAQMPQGVKAPTHTKLKEDQFDTVVAVFNQVQEE